MGARPNLAPIAVVIAIGVLGTSPAGPRPNPGARGLRIEPSGCGAVLGDGACERPLEGTVRVWIETTDPVTVRVDGEPVEGAPREQSAGTRVSLRITRSARVEITAGARSATLHVTDPPAWGWAAEAAHARVRGDFEAVRDRARPLLDDPDPAVRARAAGLVGRADLAQGRIESAAALLRRASIDAEIAGRTSDAVDDAMALSFALSNRAGRYDEANAEIDRVARLATRYPDGNARIPYYRALIASQLGHIRVVFRELRVARERAERLGLSRLAWNVRNEWALALERIGRQDEAIAELTALAETRDAEVTACERANVLHNVGFGLLLGNHERTTPCSAPSPRADPAPWLHASIALTEQQCPDAYRTAMGHQLLGEAALDSGHVDEAAAELERSNLREVSNELRGRRLDLEGRIALARGDARGALRAYERLVAFARASGRVDDERRGLEGMGEALERLERLPAALDAFAQAEDLLAAASVLVPLGEGSTYRAARDTTSRARIELLLKTGRRREALAAARRARARLLSSITSAERLADLDPEARARWTLAVSRYREERRRLDVEGAHDWELATSELVRVTRARSESLLRLRAALEDALALLPVSEVHLLPIQSMEDTLLFVTTLRTDAVVFVAPGVADALPAVASAADGHPGVRAVRVMVGAADARGAVAQRIVEAVRPELESARSVRIVTSADLACLDIHAEALAGGAPIGLQVPVTYGADLVGAEAARARPASALVVADTRDDLPLARDEGKLAASKLARDGTVIHLSGAHAQSSAVHEALATVRLFHYAGHAETLDGEIALPLAGGGRLTASDVLALPSAPEHVVLSACEAGRIDPSGLALGMGLVQAFLERGAYAVLAPSRRVRDEIAHDLATALSGSRSDDLVLAVQHLAAVRPDADWAAYRVWRR